MDFSTSDWIAIGLVGVGAVMGTFGRNVIRMLGVIFIGLAIIGLLISHHREAVAQNPSGSPGLADSAMQSNGCANIKIIGGYFSGFRRGITVPPCGSVETQGTQFQNSDTGVEVRSPGEPAEPPVINNQGGIYAPNQSGGQNIINNYGPPPRDLGSPQFSTLRAQLDQLPKDRQWRIAVAQIGGAEAMNFGTQIRDYLIASGHGDPGPMIIGATMTFKGVQFSQGLRPQIQVGLPE